ncbi:MAG: nitrous oxide reductase family maturation protein NosD [Ktedonobacterales bacterium]
MKRRPHLSLLSILVVACGMLLGQSALAATAHASDHEPTFYVSPHGSDSSGTGSRAHPFKTIEHAVTVAPSGASVVVESGVYREDVTITHELRLTGDDQPTIDALHQNNGIVIAGPRTAGTVVSGFTVEWATFEGILAVQTQGVTIQKNTIRNNDQGIFLPPSQQTGECAAAGPIPGDCGEGLHLMSVTGSKVLDNKIHNNSGGILLSDELGPTAWNRIAGNRVENNLYDCGITIVGHSPNALSSTGKRQPSVAGVHDNTIAWNVVNGNGVLGEGGGILIGVALPGSAVYNNRILDNFAEGNGLAGVTLHSHIPGVQDINDNVIVGNTLVHNALDGRGPGKPGDSDTSDTHTTDLLIAGASLVSGTVVTGNHLRDAYFGIWTQTAAPIDADDNQFNDITVHLHQQ